MDWSTLFGLSVDPVELFIRGSAIYWFLFLLFRLVLRRDIGSIAVADVLLVVLIADAAQNAMAGGYESITDGFVLVGTLAAWNLLMDWLSFHSPVLQKLLAPQPLTLVRDGQLQRKNMRREFVTVDELEAKVREAGLEQFEQVRLAMLESDGTITVIKRAGEGAASGDDPSETQRPRRGGATPR